MRQRMFVAVVPPPAVREDLADFLSARPEMPWIDSENWHVTLAFCEGVQDWRIDEFAEMLTAAATRLAPFPLRVAGGGCFPAAERARVLWMGLDESGDPSGDSLSRFARRSRAIANQIGGAPDGRRFHPHLSVARLRRPAEVTRWLRILDTYSGEPWTVDEFELVASHLGEGPGGRPRYETVARLPLGV